jgi:hypothetical protein
MQGGNGEWGVDAALADAGWAVVELPLRTWVALVDPRQTPTADDAGKLRQLIAKAVLSEQARRAKVRRLVGSKPDSLDAAKRAKLVRSLARSVGGRRILDSLVGNPAAFTGRRNELTARIVSGTAAAAANISAISAHNLPLPLDRTVATLVTPSETGKCTGDPTTVAIPSSVPDASGLHSKQPLVEPLFVAAADTELPPSLATATNAVRDMLTVLGTKDAAISVDSTVVADMDLGVVMVFARALEAEYSALFAQLARTASGAEGAGPAEDGTEGEAVVQELLASARDVPDAFGLLARIMAEPHRWSGVADAGAISANAAAASDALYRAAKVCLALLRLVDVSALPPAGVVSLCGSLLVVSDMLSRDPFDVSVNEDLAALLPLYTDMIDEFRTHFTVKELEWLASNRRQDSALPCRTSEGSAFVRTVAAEELSEEQFQRDQLLATGFAGAKLIDPWLSVATDVSCLVGTITLPLVILPEGFRREDCFWAHPRLVPWTSLGVSGLDPEGPVACVVLPKVSSADPIATVARAQTLSLLSDSMFAVCEVEEQAWANMICLGGREAAPVTSKVRADTMSPPANHGASYFDSAAMLANGIVDEESSRLWIGVSTAIKQAIRAERMRRSVLQRSPITVQPDMHSAAFAASRSYNSSNGKDNTTMVCSTGVSSFSGGLLYSSGLVPSSSEERPLPVFIDRAQYLRSITASISPVLRTAVHRIYGVGEDDWVSLSVTKIDQQICMLEQQPFFTHTDSIAQSVMFEESNTEAPTSTLASAARSAPFVNVWEPIAPSLRSFKYNASSKLESAAGTPAVKTTGHIAHPSESSKVRPGANRGKGMQTNGKDAKEDDWIDTRSMNGRYIPTLLAVRPSMPSPILGLNGGGVARNNSLQ